MLGKGQTASEYLVLLALFLIFVLLVTNPISSLSRVSFLSLDTSTYFSSLPLALEGWVHNGTHAVLFMKNTIGQTATLTKVYLNGTNVLNGTHTFSSGESRVIGVPYVAGAQYAIPFGYEYRSSYSQTRNLYADFPLTGYRGTTSVVVQSADPVWLSISSFSVSIARSNFTLVNNFPHNISVNNISIDGIRCWVPGSLPGIEGVPVNITTGSSQFFACNTHAALNANTAYSYTVLFNYTNLSSGANLSFSTIVSGTSSAFSCPTNYLPVPGMTLMDGQSVKDFCIMKYEAKAWNTTSNTVDSDGHNGGSGTQWTGTALANAQPRSEPAGYSWRNINWTDAQAECQSLGVGYDLITDQQWMTLAENIIRMPINNLNESSSEPRFGGGNNDNSPGYPIDTSSAYDPVITGCDRWKPMDNSSNDFTSTCQIRGNGSLAPFGYYGTDSNFTAAFAAGATGRSQLRTHILSNGYVVWDLPGSVYEWTNTTASNAGLFSVCGYYTNATIQSCWTVSNFSSAFSPFPWAQPSRELSVNSSVGYYYGYTATTGDRRLLRGGNWNIGGNAGLLSLYPHHTTGTWNINFGFRCAYSPQ